MDFGRLGGTVPAAGGPTDGQRPAELLDHAEFLDHDGVSFAR